MKALTTSHNSKVVRKSIGRSRPVSQVRGILDPLIRDAEDFETLIVDVAKTPFEIEQAIVDTVRGKNDHLSKKERNALAHAQNGNGPKPKANNGKGKNNKNTTKTQKQHVPNSRAMVPTNATAQVMESSRFNSGRLESFKIQLFDVIVGSSVPTGQVLVSRLIDRSLFNGTFLDPLFDQYERFQATGLSLHIVPTQATTATGSIYVQTDPDGSDVLSTNQIMPLGYLTGHKSIIQHSLFGEPFTVPCTLNKSKLFTDVNNIVVPTSSNSEIDSRFNSLGVINVYLGNGVGVSNTTLCSVWIQGKIKFMEPGFNENSKIIACFKAAGINGGAVSGTGTSFNMANVFSNVGNQVIPSSNAVPAYYAEANFAPYLFQGSGRLSLYPGMYYMETTAYPTSAPGTSTVGLSFDSGTVQSNTIQGVTTVASVGSANGYYEWYNKPNTITAPSNGWNSSGLLRITSPSTGSPFATLYVTFTSTNTVALVLASLYIIRLPDNISALYASPLPRGTGSNVSLPNMNVALSSEEYAALMDYRKIVDEKKTEENKNSNVPNVKTNAMRAVGPLLDGPNAKLPAGVVVKDDYVRIFKPRSYEEFERYAQYTPPPSPPSKSSVIGN